MARAEIPKPGREGGGAVWFFIENPKGRGVLQERARVGPRGQEGVCGELGGGVYRWAREMGTICQIGVFTGKRCIFLGPKVIFGDFALRFQRKSPKYCLIKHRSFCSSKSLKMACFGPKNALFCCKNGNLTNGAYFTHIRGGGG